MTDDELLTWYVCGRKCRHADERAARTGAHIAGKGHYHCTVCDGWHVGTPPTRHVKPGRLLKRARAKYRRVAVEIIRQDGRVSRGSVSAAVP